MSFHSWRMQYIDSLRDAEARLLRAGGDPLPADDEPAPVEMHALTLAAREARAAAESLRAVAAGVVERALGRAAQMEARVAELQAQGTDPARFVFLRDLPTRAIAARVPFPGARPEVVLRIAELPPGHPLRDIPADQLLGGQSLVLGLPPDVTFQHDAGAWFSVDRAIALTREREEARAWKERQERENLERLLTEQREREAREAPEAARRERERRERERREREKLEEEFRQRRLRGE